MKKIYLRNNRNDLKSSNFFGLFIVYLFLLRLIIERNVYGMYIYKYIYIRINYF